MKKFLIGLTIMAFISIPLSVKASEVYYDDEDTTETSTEVAIEDMPFVKTDKVSITDGKFTKKSIYVIKWDKFPGADGYEFKLCINKSFKKKFKPSSAEITQNQMQVNKVKKKYTYYYKVRAFRQTDDGYEYSKWTKTHKFKRKK